ncbi:MAG TPA: hypothetical protein EYN43_00070 [Gammaproteobacteria bacterium]|nr:hypothetical protein [Gammaproteobacteria bacterium]
MYQNLESGSNPPLRAASEPVVRPRDASSLIITRRERQKIFVLMGRRSPTARFMPGVFVFPGGAVSSGDGRVLPAAELDPTYAPLMGIGRSHSRARALAMAAVRETWEETGLLVAVPGRFNGSRTASWQAIRSLNQVPDLRHLRYVGRAITPSFSKIRFHARFFTVDASHLSGELRGDGELVEVGWWNVADLNDLPMRGVTRFMLDRAVALVRGEIEERPAPIFRWRGSRRVAWR